MAALRSRSGVFLHGAFREGRSRGSLDLRPDVHPLRSCFRAVSRERVTIFGEVSVRVLVEVSHDRDATLYLVNVVPFLSGLSVHEETTRGTGQVITIVVGRQSANPPLMGTNRRYLSNRRSKKFIEQLFVRKSSKITLA